MAKLDAIIAPKPTRYQVGICSNVLKSGKLTDEVTTLIKGIVADMSKNYEA